MYIATDFVVLRLISRMDNENDDMKLLLSEREFVKYEYLNITFEKKFSKLCHESDLNRVDWIAIISNYSVGCR